jgi:hypothetical protein
MSSCKDYLDVLYPPKQERKEPQCLMTLQWFYNNVGVKADSTRFSYDSNRRLSHVTNVRYLEDGTVTKSGGIAPTRTYNADGSPDLIIYPDNKSVVRYSYANKKLTKAELLENGQVIQTFTITRDALGRVREAIGSGTLNNTRTVYTYNEQGYATNMDRYDEQGNRIFWNIYEEFDPAVTKPYLHAFPYEQGQLLFDVSDFAAFNTNVFGHANANGPYRHGIFYSAVDGQGKYNGVTKVLADIRVNFKANSKGFLKERNFKTATGLEGTTFYEYADCD